MLITGLKNLNSNIKHYIDELTKHKTVAEIMHVLFNDYITNVVDKAYHRLRTSDNVSKFRPEIIERLESKSHNEDYIAKTAKEISGIREVSEEDGRELVYKYLHEIIEAFRNMDDILMEIDQKIHSINVPQSTEPDFFFPGMKMFVDRSKRFCLGSMKF